MTVLTQAEISEFIDHAFAEDIGPGDITSDNVIPADARLRVALETREDIVVAGLDIALECFRKLVPDAKITKHCEDGDAITAKDVLAVVEGNARGILTAERTALNTLQHLSGIATTTRSYVAAMGDTTARLLDTRKTLPGWRKMEKYATRMGGAQNHRMGLYDGVMIKDNHIGVVGSITECVRSARAANLPKIEVECDTLDQVREAADAGADIILLDNMGPDMLRQAVAIVAGRCKTEASGGVNLQTIGAIATTGVDYVSVGRITQSAPAVDIGLDVAILLSGRITMNAIRPAPRIVETANWIFRDGGKILSVRSHGRDRFYLPGGKIDADETAIEALIREIREELGVTLIEKSIRPLGLYAGHGHNQPTGAIVRMQCFAARFTGRLTPSREIAEMRWLSQRDRHLMAPMGQKITAALFDI